MKLSTIKKLHQVKFEAEDGGEPLVLNVRAADQSHYRKWVELEEQYRAEKGLGPDADIPGVDGMKLNRRAEVGTLLDGWTGAYEDDWTPIPDRNPDGSLNVEGGLLILSNDDIHDAYKLKLISLRAARATAEKAARGNSEAPSEAS